MTNDAVSRKQCLLLIGLSNLVWLAVLLVALGIMAREQRAVARQQANEIVQEKIVDMQKELKSKLYPMYDELGVEYDRTTGDFWEIIGPLLRLTEPTLGSQHPQPGRGEEDAS